MFYAIGSCPLTGTFILWILKYLKQVFQSIIICIQQVFFYVWKILFIDAVTYNLKS